MSDMKKSWEEAGSKLSSLGLKLKYHFEEEHSEEVADADEMRGAVEKLRDALDGAFEAMGDAAKDPAVKEDVRESAKLLRDALADTFSEAGDALRGAFGSLDDPAPAELDAPQEAVEEATEAPEDTPEA
jgi:Flp pilus assembly pilin Flp